MSENQADTRHCKPPPGEVANKDVGNVAASHSLVNISSEVISRIDVCLKILAFVGWRERCMLVPQWPSVR
jgi:hypothetical protein